MLFNSYVFIFMFLPLTLGGWFWINSWGKYRFAQYYLILMSLWFYAYFNMSYVFIILGSMLGNYAVSGMYCLKKVGNNQLLRKSVTILGVSFNLGLLFYYKYYDFFIENMNVLFKTDWNLKNIVLPLGISFFTFQQLGYILDRSRGEAPQYSLIDYATFVIYFPQLIAGPIVHHADIIPQFKKEKARMVSYENLTRGTILFVLGLAKKVLLADTLARLVNYGWGNLATLDSLGALTAMLAYTFEIFFDFSGYCDMAVGLGLMMNIKIPINFNAPYKAKSVREFWKRWHITLNTFFTKYVYIPLGGSRKGNGRTVANVLIVFLLSGIWHGANWTFILWGILHGIVVAGGTLSIFRIKNMKLKWFGTFVFVNLAWVLFRSDSLQEAFVFYQKLFSFENTGAIFNLANSLKASLTYVPVEILKRININLIKYFYLVQMLCLMMICGWNCYLKDAYILAKRCELKWKTAVILGGLFAFSVISLSGVSTFLYFNF